MDISGQEIDALYEECPTKKWIIRIPLDKTIAFEDYIHRSLFLPIVDVHLEDLSSKRITVLNFKPCINKEVYQRKTEWIYMITINDRIIKIGGTRSGMKGRVGSYLCGHHTTERGKSGDCSNTNAFVYNTLEFYLKLGCSIRFYGYELPVKKIEIELLGETREIITQTYHAYESIFMEDYKKQYSSYPILSFNADPNYRD